ncbi:hypothetical protein [Novosphingobium gossypii]|uniref:hypothetical protein n=1 Tax=Novosphingobium gossypii TaxID=1604774 RepID=UPI003D230CFC
MRNIAVPRSPGALTAISAVLALSAIPAVAQDVQPSTAPVQSLQQGAAAAPATPTVTLPPEATAPMNVPIDTTTSAGATSTAPAPTSAAPPTVVLPDVAPPTAPAEAVREPATPRPATQAAAPARPEPVRAEPAPIRPTVPTAQNGGTATDGTLAQGSVPPAAPAPARADPAPAATAAQPAPATDRGDGFPVAEVAGILAALGVAGLGIAAMRRRRDPVYEEADHAAVPLEPVPAPAPVTEVAAPVIAEPAPFRRNSVIAGNSATAILAASPLPQTAEERYELLDAMAAAAPDEGNPFTSRKGRLRRARLQLQHRESEEANGRTGGFDFRTYKPTRRTPESVAPARQREYTQA